MKTIKISAQALGFAVAVIAVWVLKQWGGVEAPDPVVVAIGTLCSIVASLFIPDEKEE